MNIKTIRIIKASGPDRNGLLDTRIKEIETAGFRVLFDDIKADPHWTFTAGSVKDRLAALEGAFIEDKSDAVMWVRGGYGASDLLPLLAWDKIKAARPKPIIGFSDVCAAQSALFVHTGRISLHAQMPATTTWKKNGEDDVIQLFETMRGARTSGTINVAPIGLKAKSATPAGRLFGGWLTVLSSLIGTPYLPRHFDETILFFEDVGENPGRVLRNLNQWQQAGHFRNIEALVLGSFTDMGAPIPDNASFLYEEVAARFDIPVFASTDFGHVSPNYLLPVGGHGTIKDNLLTWNLSDHFA